MRRTILALAVLLGAAQVAHADSRFFCSADDKDVRFTVESGFEADGGHKLNHFRGAIMLKSADAPQSLKKITLDSDSLTNRWSHAGELRLEVLYDGGENAGEQTINLVVAASERGKGAAFSGTYELTAVGATKPLSASGKVSCGSK